MLRAARDFFFFNAHRKRWKIQTASFSLKNANATVPSRARKRNYNSPLNKLRCVRANLFTLDKKKAGRQRERERETRALPVQHGCVIEWKIQSASSLRSWKSAREAGSERERERRQIEQNAIKPGSRNFAAPAHVHIFENSRHCCYCCDVKASSSLRGILRSQPTQFDALLYIYVCVLSLHVQYTYIYIHTLADSISKRAREMWEGREEEERGRESWKRERRESAWICDL